MTHPESPSPTHDLAIVIPAFKPEFFQDSLASIASQTDKRFTVYIGDDASPYDLAEIVEPFRGMFDVRYHRFDSNLGREDVVAQWERCIDLTCGEAWIWLFSDDDLMDPECVQSFYSALSEDMDEGYANIYRFNTIIIDGQSTPVGHLTIQPRRQSSQAFLSRGLLYRTTVYIVDGIFSIKAFRERGGFVRFNKGWGSDNATWIRLGYGLGMRGIRGPLVRWRLSDINISGEVADPENRRRKRHAAHEYMAWLREERNAGRLRFSSAGLWLWYIVMLKVIGYWRIPFRRRPHRGTASRSL